MVDGLSNTTWYVSEVGLNLSACEQNRQETSKQSTWQHHIKSLLQNSYSHGRNGSGGLSSAAGLDAKAEDVQVNTFMYTMGDEADDVLR